MTEAGWYWCLLPASTEFTQQVKSNPGPVLICGEDKLLGIVLLSGTCVILMDVNKCPALTLLSPALPTSWHVMYSGL
jgi:hypothetical protein